MPYQLPCITTNNPVIWLTVGHVPIRSGILASDVQSTFVKVVTVVDRRLLARHTHGDVFSHNVTASLLKMLAMSGFRPHRELTSGALQTSDPARGSNFFETVPQKFFMVMSSIVRLAFKWCLVSVH